MQCGARPHREGMLSFAEVGGRPVALGRAPCCHFVEDIIRVMPAPGKDHVQRKNKDMDEKGASFSIGGCRWLTEDDLKPTSSERRRRAKGNTLGHQKTDDFRHDSFGAHEMTGAALSWKSVLARNMVAMTRFQVMGDKMNF